MQCLCFTILAALLIVPSSLVADDTYNVTLVSVYTNKPALGTDGDNVRLTIDGTVHSTKDPSNDGEKSLWRFDKRKTTRVDIPCVRNQPLEASFVIQLDAIGNNGKQTIGIVTATLKKEDDELRLAFEMKHGKRTRRLRRRMRTGARTIWVTRVFPLDGSANYVLGFEIKKAPETG